MTIEEKARAYDEALEVMRQWIAPCHTKEQLDTLKKSVFPELAESDDEKARKWIYDFIRNCPNESFEFYGGVGKKAVLAYLEKQKEPVVNKEGMYYYLGGKFIYCGYSAIEGNPYDFAMNQQEKQKEQKPCWNPTEEDVALFNKAITTNTSLSPQERAKLDILRMKFKHCPVIEQKEQKPVEWDEYTKTNLDRALQIIKKAKGTLQGYQSDDGIYECDKAIECLEHFLYRGFEIEKSIKCIEFDNEFDNQVSHLLASVLNGEHEYNKDFVKYATQSLLGYAKNELKSVDYEEELENCKRNPLYFFDKYVTVKLKPAKLKAERDGWYVCIKDYYRGGKKQSSVGDLVQAKGGMYIMGEEDISEWFRRAYYEEVRDAFESNTDTNVPEKPVEWSDEDEKIYQTVFNHFNSYEKYSCSTGVKKEHILSWLKSLRPVSKESLQPHWKPSEQEKGALRTAIYILTEERNFPKAAAQLQNILDAFEGKESRKDWKPSEDEKSKTVKQ